MLIALCGVSGVGKSFFSKTLSEKIDNLKKLRTIRIRKPRNKAEIEDKYSIFMSEEELNKYALKGKIALQFELYNSKYAYLKEEIYGKDNYIFEMHYSKIDECKKLLKNIKVIYIFPKNLQIALEKIKERNLDKFTEENRINEAKEQNEFIKNNSEFLANFDHIFVNNYDEKSVIELEKVVKNFLN